MDLEDSFFHIVPLDKSYGTVIDGLGRESMGPEYREVEDVPWLCELEEELFPFCRLQEELCPTLAQGVPTNHWCTLVEDGLEFIVTDIM